MNKIFQRHDQVFVSEVGKLYKLKWEKNENWSRPNMENKGNMEFGCGRIGEDSRLKKRVLNF